MASLILSLAVSAWLANAALLRLQREFETHSDIVHRVLSLRAVEHEAILATLALLDTPATAEAAHRLPSIYPRILTVLRRQGEETWSAVPVATELAVAEAASRRAGRAWGLVSAMEQGRLWLVLAGETSSHALQIDLAGMVTDADWPFDCDTPVRVELVHAGHQWRIHAGADLAGGWRFVVDTPLAARSQPFDVVAERRVGWNELPWGAMLASCVLITGIMGGLVVLRQQRVARRRAEELLRLGQVGRLNAMGELAAGMAHELNQPLTAILANTQAAVRLLRDEPPDTETASVAMEAAAAQARRTADVLARLRRTVERPGRADPLVEADLGAVVGAALHLLEPRLKAAGVRVSREGESALKVRGDSVAVEQIVHNLLANALQALQRVPEGERRLRLTLEAQAGQASLTVIDHGPGIPEAQRARVFEPFYTTREDGLGLGLSLCESLAASMDGQLELLDLPGPGAAFRLTLPCVQASSRRSRTDLL